MGIATPATAPIHLSVVSIREVSHFPFRAFPVENWRRIERRDSDENTAEKPKRR
jgi:hypothetical protein